VIGGRYSLRTAIGHGGMGTVWRASDTLLRRDVAVKEVLLPPGIADGEREQMYTRTLREARAAAALSHPAVVQVYDVVTEAGRPWIVMELLQSRSLAEMIIEDGPLAPRAVGKIGVALLGALEVAHAAGVLHRDVKPANVLICSDGRCVLTDFGVARMPTDSQLTTPGMVLGSPHFISPERAIGAKFGPPSDLFSLGVTLYTAVEGRPPFDKRDPFETMRAVVEEPPVPPVRAGSLTGVLYGLLEKDPDRRWSIPATRRVLRELLAGPLASQAAAHMTDPYAVVRPAPFVPPTAEPAPTGQIGGKAMLAPGESITGALRRRASGQPGTAGPESVGRGASPTTQVGTDTAPADQLPPPLPQRFAGGQRRAPYQPSHLPSPQLSEQPTQITRAPVHQSAHAYPMANRFGPPPKQSPPQRAMAAFRQLPQWGQIGAGITALLIIVFAIGIPAGWLGADDDSRRTPVANTSPSPSQPTLKVLEYRDDAKGIVVNVPDGWTKVQTKSYVDFVDPADEGRRLRVNVEPATTARGFLEVAERGLQKGTGQCATPYGRVELRDITLDGRPAAELEYTCGQGDQMRHGIWAALVYNGKAYEFFVSVRDAQFKESMPIYQEMVKSYRLAA
jgi:hypothetical protein